MSAHTPGQWSEEIISDSGGGDRWQVVAETERVCVLSRNEHARSNAKLIAAAPMLLDALRFLLREEPNIYEGRLEASLYVTVDALEFARAAIAKAEGRS